MRPAPFVSRSKRAKANCSLPARISSRVSDRTTKSAVTPACATERSIAAMRANVVSGSSLQMGTATTVRGCGARRSGRGASDLPPNSPISASEAPHASQAVVAKTSTARMPSQPLKPSRAAASAKSVEAMTAHPSETVTASARAKRVRVSAASCVCWRAIGVRPYGAAKRPASIQKVRPDVDAVPRSVWASTVAPLAASSFRPLSSLPNKGNPPR